MVNVNEFNGANDSQIINNAIAARGEDGIVVVHSREKNDGRDFWLLDEAVLLPENTTVVIKNCKIKLSDNCRDNFFRSANCGIGKGDPEVLHNIHIIGEGCAMLEGADRPRATGDSSKILAAPCPHEEKDLFAVADWISEAEKEKGKLNFGTMHSHSYGTDCNKDGESKMGDWRGIGILLANVENFSIENITIKESHGWGISLESCRQGKIEKIRFDATMYKYIDGIKQNMENQDGIDVRNGCCDIVISEITGETGDDVIALTAIADNSEYKGGGYNYTHVMHSDWTRRESGIKNITIKNVVAKSYLCWMVRLLACNIAVIENVTISDIKDTSEKRSSGGILVGEYDGAYGLCLPDSIKNISVSNVETNSFPVIVLGYLSDSTIINAVNRIEEGQIVKLERANGLKNVKIN